MTNRKRTYSAGFKREAVQLWKGTNKTASEVEQELGITPGLLGRWNRKLKNEGEPAFPGQGRLSVEQARIRQLIDDHRDEFPIRLMCRVLLVSSSGYYAWRGRTVGKREMANQDLLEAIRLAFNESKATYGSPRIYEVLKKEFVCSKNRIARLMKKHNIQVKRKKRYKVTTQANATHPKAPNRLSRNFSAVAPNRKWTADITYIATAEGWLYLAVILDLYSRRIIGWAMSSRMTGDLVTEALAMALKQRNPAAGLLHHSDRGSQYTAAAYRLMLKKNHCKISVSRKGDCYDNAPTESFFGTLKAERVERTNYQTRAEARSDIFFYIEGWYNSKRIHSTLGYLSPEAYETAYFQHQSDSTVCQLTKLGEGQYRVLKPTTCLSS